MGHPPSTFVIPTEAQRRGGTCSFPFGRSESVVGYSLGAEHLRCAPAPAQKSPFRWFSHNSAGEPTERTGCGKKASRMNRREFTAGLAAAALYASRGKASAAWLPGNDSGLSMTKLQQQFLDLRFGMYIHLNMATYEQRSWGDPKASPALFNPKALDTDQWAMLPAPPEWRMAV